MERNFDTFKVGRWYTNDDKTFFEKIVIYDPKDQTYKGGSNHWYSKCGNNLVDLTHEFPEGWEPIPSATTDEWPARYEVGMRFERADGEVVECDMWKGSGVFAYIGGWHYYHGSKGGTKEMHLNADKGIFTERNRLDKWLNPEAFPDVPRIGQAKKPQYDRDEVLRVATALVGSLKIRYRSDAPIAYAVNDAIELIDAVNERVKGGK